MAACNRRNIIIRRVLSVDTNECMTALSGLHCDWACVQMAVQYSQRVLCIELQRTAQGNKAHVINVITDVDYKRANHRLLLPM